MAAAKTVIKESLLGAERDPDLSTQTRSTFDRNARQDESSEEGYMTEEDFINAIAPDSEDYVRRPYSQVHSSSLHSRVEYWESLRLIWLLITA